MKTISDYSTPTSLATNAACPQRPTWRISPVGYEWAQAVFEDCKQGHACIIKKGAEARPKPVQIWRWFLSKFSQAVLVSRRQTGIYYGCSCFEVFPRSGKGR